MGRHNLYKWVSFRSASTIRKAELQSADIKRYGIQTVWVEEYADIPPLLKTLETFVTRGGVFVAGAAIDPAPLGSERLNELSRALGYSIIGQGFNLVSGFGIGIAEQSILGAFHAIYENATVQPAERVLIRPFPGHVPASARGSAFRRHREDLMSRVGALVVLAGNKAGPDGKVVQSTGVEEEVEIALSLGKPIIPVGMSGHVAQNTWTAANADPDRYLPGIECRSELTILGNADSTNEQVVAAVISLLQRAEHIASTKS